MLVISLIYIYTVASPSCLTSVFLTNFVLLLAFDDSSFILSLLVPGVVSLRHAEEPCAASSAEGVEILYYDTYRRTANSPFLSLKLHFTSFLPSSLPNETLYTYTYNSSLPSSLPPIFTCSSSTPAKTSKPGKGTQGPSRPKYQYSSTHSRDRCPGFGGTSRPWEGRLRRVSGLPPAARAWRSGRRGLPGPRQGGSGGNNCGGVNGEKEE